MSTSDVVGAVILFVLAAILLILSIRHFMEKGLLLNNAYLYATAKLEENDEETVVAKS